MLRSPFESLKSIGSAAKKPFACLAIFAAMVLGTVSDLAAQNAVQAPYIAQGGQYRIQQVQSMQPSPPGTPVRRPLHHLIDSMPSIQEDLEVIHHRSQLIRTTSGVVRTAVADPSIVQIVHYSPDEIAVLGLDIGSTTLTIWFENERDPLIYLVNVIRDPSIEERRRIDYGKLERKLAVLFPDSKVYLIPLSGKIIVKGQARDSEEAAQILQIIRGEFINQYGSLGGPQPDQPAGVDTPYNNLDLVSQFIVNMLDVPGEKQVMLHVRIAELNRAQLRQMGFDINVLFDGGRHAVNALAGGIPATLSGIFENGEVNVLLNWLRSNGSAQILTEPTVTVLSGHSASFLSGGEFPVPTIVGVGGAQASTTTFRGFGTSLVVTPTVMDKDNIRMQIIPEFSAINSANGNNGIQGLDSRRVQTTVELREGQTIAIAGLISHQTSTENTGIPFLGELPFIGPILFNAKRATQDESELLVLVTPELVRPMDADEVPPVPGFYVTHPNNTELYKYGMIEGVPDERVYQLAPYGSGSGVGMDVGYRLFNPAPASPMYSPVPNNAYGNQQYGAGMADPNSMPPTGAPQTIPQRSGSGTNYPPTQVSPGPQPHNGLPTLVPPNQTRPTPLPQNTAPSIPPIPDAAARSALPAQFPSSGLTPVNYEGESQGFSLRKLLPLPSRNATHANYPGTSGYGRSVGNRWANHELFSR